MRIFTNASILLVLFATMVSAQKTKDLEARADVTSEQSIRLDGFKGADLVIRTWDKPQVEIKLNIRIEMSSESAEDDYIKAVELEQDQTSGMVVFRLNQPDVNTGFSLKNLLKLRFNTYVKKQIRGEVFLPKMNNFLADVRYGKLDIEGLGGVVEIESQSAMIDIRSCEQLETIQNNYGTTSIERSGGNLTLDNKSGKVDIKTFDGTLNMKARYATVTAEDVSGMVNVESQSGSVTLMTIGGDVIVDAPYSTIVIQDVKGFATVKDKSGSVKVVNVVGLEVDAPYSTIDARDVTATDGRPVIVSGQSGKISLSRISSAIDVQSPYTNIDLSEIGGDVRLGTKSGSVRANEVTGNWTSQTEYSRIIITDLAAQTVTIENKSGVVDVDLKTVPDMVEIVNSYADVNLKLPRGLDANVRLKAEYGSITSDLDVTVEKMGSSTIALGKIGSGSGTLTIETKSGQITVREK